MLARTVDYTIFFSFMVFGMWEWVQTPFYIDNTQNNNTVVWYRLHCTFADTMVFIGIGALVGIYRKSALWILHPHKTDFLAVTIMGVFYTAISEYRNVVIRQNWNYSDWMPVIPGIDIGVIPIIQWLVLPSAVIILVRDHFKGVQ